MVSTVDGIPPWVIGVAGSTGATVANALVYPLDIVKTRLQVQLKKSNGTTGHAERHHYKGTWHAILSILKDEGCLGLYHGLPVSSLGTASTNYAYFYWYSILRTLYLTKIQASTTIAADLGLGTAAGALAQLCTAPIAVVTARQQTRPDGEKKTTFQTTRDIIDGPDGYAGLWRGIKASLVLSVNPAITYGAYQRLRDVLYSNKKNLSPHEAFLLGALSKCIATIVTQPLIVARATLQSHLSSDPEKKPFKSFQEVLKYIIAHEGVLGLYKGLTPQILKGLLVQGILMMIKERVELIFVLLFRHLRKRIPQMLMKPARSILG
ncbi:Peroxisomal adenine nucleotide transporter 1 [Tolypocladium ophioglossoides CBS 100239]|uniref:Peroxisomal adenine nucleotide transporter 1 n=1 Tax=Tolypocladium ophioglossoides (strain CBS 100239) TaxID=1163406 RepID=A0A0L0N0L1_TOLOC|nr:Peroxisomal adenine nucleotide transporter 1 [Tolypocladium ophioglossoides CBS 100239]